MPQTNGRLDGADWDKALESGNRWFDQLVAVVTTDRAVRVEKLSRFRADLRLFQKEASEGIFAKPRGEVMGYVSVSSQIHLVGIVLDGDDRAQQSFNNITVAFALACYHRTNGQYPDSLAKLAPVFLNAVPEDLFSGKELIYRPAPNGFLLYSVGLNGTDDGARGPDDQPPGDDIVVRIPQAAKP